MREQPKKWCDEIIDALIELGGNAHIKEICKRIQQRGIMNFKVNKSWKARVGTTLQWFSSDAKIFNGKKDIFYKDKSQGKGYWGLRNFSPRANNFDLGEYNTGFLEGKTKLTQHVYRERNPKVIKLAKDNFKKEHNGELYCEICKFNFYDTYGEIGQDFIEGHHIIPVSEMKEGDMTRVEDILLVCPNCHRMLHRNQWLTKDKLKEIVEIIKDNNKR